MQRDRVTEPLEPDYNVAPTKPVYAVLTRRARQQEADNGGEPVARELRVVRWGLVPWWAKDVSIGSRLINARAETVSEKPAFRKAFASRRCLLPADGYYEWQKPEDTSGGTGSRPAKQPFYISRGDGGPLAFAGLYELWRDRKIPDGDQDAWLWTATIITTRAPDELGRIHDRMPMVIAPGSFQDWLDPASSDPADLIGLLAPAAAGGLTSYPVSRAVNSVRNNGPELIEPIEPGEPTQTTPLPAPAARSGNSLSGASPIVSGSAPGTLF